MQTLGVLSASLSASLDITPSSIRHNCSCHTQPHPIIRLKINLRIQYYATKMVDSHYTQLKRNYEQRCREVDAADEAFKKSVSLASKDEEKVMKVK